MTVRFCVRDEYIEVDVERRFVLPFAPFVGLSVWIPESEPPATGRARGPSFEDTALADGRFKIAEVSYEARRDEFHVMVPRLALASTEELRASVSHLISRFGFELGVGQVVPGFPADQGDA